MSIDFEKARALAGAAGLRLHRKALSPEGYTYLNGDAYVDWAFNPWTRGNGNRYGSAMAVHEVAHYLLAPPERRALPNFGLGNHPYVALGETRTETLLTRSEVSLEEHIASLLHLHLVGLMWRPNVVRHTANALNLEDFLNQDGSVWLWETGEEVRELRKVGLYPLPESLEAIATLPPPPAGTRYREV
jgi:hypothetical protein